MVSEKKREEVVNEFINRNGIRPYVNDIVKIMIYIFITPISEYHNHDPNIIWFDFDKLYELEEWVSNKLGNPFKLERLNSSKHIECNLKRTDNFIKKYNIYIIMFYIYYYNILYYIILFYIIL